MCEYIISHHACSEDQLLGLVVTRQLRGEEKKEICPCTVLNMVTVVIILTILEKADSVIWCQKLSPPSGATKE